MSKTICNWNVVNELTNHGKRLSGSSATSHVIETEVGPKSPSSGGEITFAPPHPAGKLAAGLFRMSAVTRTRTVKNCAFTQDTQPTEATDDAGLTSCRKRNKFGWLWKWKGLMCYHYSNFEESCEEASACIAHFCIKGVLYTAIHPNAYVVWSKGRAHFEDGILEPKQNMWWNSQFCKIDTNHISLLIIYATLSAAEHLVFQFICAAKPSL